MGLTKTEAFTLKDQRLAELLKAIGHPARISILRLLSKKDECYCGDIVDELPLSQSTVSQHLNALKDAGLIKGNTEGRNVCYCLDEKAWNNASALVGELFAKLSQNKQCC